MNSDPWNTYTFGEWAEYKSSLFTVLSQGEQPKRGRFLYRGQRDPEWLLASTFDRSFPGVTKEEKRRLEDTLLDHFRYEFEADEDTKYREVLNHDVETKALAQHCGVPTRLLDWSESPYVGAFFAFQHAVSVYKPTVEVFAPNDGHVAIWALDTQSEAWHKDSGVEVVTPSTLANPRMRAQAGSFTLARTPYGSLQEYLLNFPDDSAKGALRLFLIPARDAQVAMADLDLMGICESTLFGDHSARARTAITKTALGVPVRGK